MTKVKNWFLASYLRGLLGSVDFLFSDCLRSRKREDSSFCEGIFLHPWRKFLLIQQSLKSNQ